VDGARDDFLAVLFDAVGSGISIERGIFPPSCSAPPRRALETKGGVELAPLNCQPV
jgi:hypothetical protein